jgi:hypothetical protein
MTYYIDVKLPTRPLEWQGMGQCESYDAASRLAERLLADPVIRGVRVIDGRRSSCEVDPVVWSCERGVTLVSAML